MDFLCSVEKLTRRHFTLNSVFSGHLFACLSKSFLSLQSLVECDSIQTATPIPYQSASTQETKIHIKYNRRNLMRGILRGGILRGAIAEVRHEKRTSRKMRD